MNLVDPVEVPMDPAVNISWVVKFVVLVMPKVKHYKARLEKRILKVPKLIVPS